jgi:hypothetical protein
MFHLYSIIVDNIYVVIFGFYLLLNAFLAIFITELSIIILLYLLPAIYYFVYDDLQYIHNLIFI